MPQVTTRSGGPHKPDKRPKTSGDGVKLSADVSELPKKLIIGGGTILVLIAISVLFFMFRPTPKAKLDHVPPPPGYPDMPPYNTKAWQQHPTPISGIPGPEAMRRMNGGALPKPPPGANQ